ncbi:carboxypeptidase regulatory-like domain-containing protein [Saccharopolyspora sp. TS4A08]|uniref:Carboxypeptidase regulatory-like domain-containing protein n=1 Tax=Saccharopolyspora ipomoeae TaxID=3042027 RepID=A0ABT6PJB6_9PSEU|nr:carboxypeptidase regulatory-like domain-containing protein [Saccharopolyspora sp. TS4A08]MDI2028090.1 carboxypeptidase regulatory-like domain-containing protein [Saccharopolyspora sp. TS4A08]
MTEPQPPSTVRTLVNTLWFPAFFICGFMLCYLLPLHAPKPHDMPVVVVGDQAAHQLATTFEAAMPGGFDVTAVPDEAGAREAITQREAVAGYDPDNGELLYAKANGSALMMILQQIFTPVASATGHHLVLTDLAPSAPGDVMGTGLLYCLLAMNIPPYVTVMMLLRAELRTRQKLAALVGVGAFAAVVCYSAALAMGVIYNRPLLLLVGFLLTQAVGWTSFGLVPFVKQFLPGVAMGTFVLLSMPSSGGAIPKELVPPFFQALHGFLPLGQAVDAMRGILYFDGVGAPRGIIGLCCWYALGIALVVGHRLWVRRKGDPAAVTAAGTYEHEDDGDVVVDPVLEAPKPRKHRTLSGTVRDGDGTPVPGAILTITDQSGLQLARLVTSTDGEYEVHDLPEGFATVVVSAQGRRPAVDRVPVRSGRSGDQDFVLSTERLAARR